MGAYFRTATYCAGHSPYLVYELDWLYELARDVDPMAPRLVLAHEWAHHIQHFMAVPTQGIAAELEADCLVGLYAASLAAQDPAAYEAVTADLAMVYERGSEAFPASAWFADARGGTWQRALAFETGRVTNDASYCRAYEGTEPVEPLSLSGHYLAVPPTGTLISLDKFTTGIEVPGRPFAAVGQFTGVTGTAEDRVERFMSSWRVADREIFPLWEGASPYDAFFTAGTTAVRIYDRFDPDGTRYALFFTHVAQNGAAIVLEVSAPGSFRQDPDVARLLNHLHVLVRGVCPKGGRVFVGCPP